MVARADGRSPPGAEERADAAESGLQAGALQGRSTGSGACSDVVLVRLDVRSGDVAPGGSRRRLFGEEAGEVAQVDLAAGDGGGPKRDGELVQPGARLALREWPPIFKPDWSED